MIKRILGIDKIEQDLEVARQALDDAKAKQIVAEQATKLAQEQEELAKLSPKDRATRKKEAW